MRKFPTRDQVLKAIEEYNSGARPENSGRARRYYMVCPETRELYPLKLIWGLATGRPNSEFGMNAALRNTVRRLGFEWIDAQASFEEQSNFQKRVLSAQSENQNKRKARLKNASKTPSLVLRTSIGYRRNPDVIAERLKIANGHCEACLNPAPFKRSTDGTPFLEVHHIIPLSDGGDDTVENTQALCPNCHRKAHFG